MLPSMDPADVALLQAVGEDKAHLILRNDLGALWAHVRGLEDSSRVDFVLDNGKIKSLKSHLVLDLKTNL
jgi:hypothetical protein